MREDLQVNWMGNLSQSMNHDAAQGRRLTLCGRDAELPGGECVESPCGQGAEDSSGQDVETPYDRGAETPCCQDVGGP